jgi:hypothetical protein
MPSDCVRALHDWSGTDGVEPDSVLASSEWRLLMQISAGDGRRTYVWIRRSDFDAAEFGTLCVFVR